jgi:CRISPR/Cas system-associated exonuclease Cas4 (RecB family)
MGFNVTKANIVIPKVYQEIEKKSLIQPIIRYLQKIDRDSFIQEYGDQVKIHKMSLTPLRRERALKFLDNLFHYWKEERKANFSDSYYKCRACSYKDTCPGSKAK